jgi:hypothetical protein
VTTIQQDLERLDRSIDTAIAFQRLLLTQRAELLAILKDVSGFCPALQQNAIRALVVKIEGAK